jgi:hypothetical protein
MLRMQVGVGTSQLQADMVQQGGYQNILNTDISSVVVQHMQDLHKSIPQLQYRIGDARCGRFFVCWQTVLLGCSDAK